MFGNYVKHENERCERLFVLPRARCTADSQCEGWPEAFRLPGYAPKKRREPMLIQDVLFSYLEAL